LLRVEVVLESEIPEPFVLSVLIERYIQNCVSLLQRCLREIQIRVLNFLKKVIFLCTLLYTALDKSTPG
jgi:hypothetical protein